MKKKSTRLIKITASIIFFSAALFLFIKQSDSQLFDSLIYKKYFGTKSDAPHNVTCASCHLTHNSTGEVLTSLAGNANLCMSCHNPVGTASSLPFAIADIADPTGGTGTSHAWDVDAVNTTYETNLPSDTEMAKRIGSGKIVCSTCHDQHSQTYTPFLRAPNTGDVMCKDCHSARDVGRYADDNVTHRGSHPVGLVYDGADPKLKATPTAPLQLIGSNIECSSCHQIHYSTSTDGNILRTTNNNALCTSCHTYSSHNGFSCNDCHQPHNTVKDNIYMVKDVVNGSSVNFYAETGTNSFGDGNTSYDGICEVCHTGTSYHLADGTGASHNPGTNCTSCHPHEDNFAPAGCSDCHIATFPGWGTTDGHFAHTSKYTFACSTCHLNYGSGGSLEPTHPSGGNANVNLNPFGLATRNGLDANTPTWNGTTCANIYCHSNGRTAYRGTNGTYTWSGTTGSQTAIYATIPAWNSAIGTISSCTVCHSGTGSMTDPYTITSPGLADPLPPATGSHLRGAHTSNSQELKTNGWDAVNCFWCHNNNSGDDGSPIYQGTYGTNLHVDGQTHFDPRSFVAGGTLVNNPTGGLFSYSYSGSAGHCGNGKTCW